MVKPQRKDYSKSIIFWDVTPCSLREVHHHFGGTYWLHLQGQRVNQAASSRPQVLTPGIFSQLEFWKQSKLKKKINKIIKKKNYINYEY
jgi:hypothetical protein